MRGRKKNWPCSSMGFVLLVSKSDGNAQVLQIATSLKAGRKARICVSPRFSEDSKRSKRRVEEICASCSKKSGPAGAADLAAGKERVNE